MSIVMRLRRAISHTLDGLATDVGYIERNAHDAIAALDAAKVDRWTVNTLNAASNVILQAGSAYFCQAPCKLTLPPSTADVTGQAVYVSTGRSAASVILPAVGTTIRGVYTSYNIPVRSSVQLSADGTGGWW